MATTLSIKVIPGSSRDAIAEWLGDSLKVRVRAPPERGKANAAVQSLLADALGVRATTVRVTRGHTSQRKSVTIEGLSDTEVKVRLRHEDG